jgi:hypothetical protein
MRVLSLPEVNQKLEDASQKERAMAFPNCSVSLDEQEKELIEIFKAPVNICQK